MIDNLGSIRIETVTYHDSLVAIKDIRTRVFQEEQGVSADLEFDGWDESTIHFLAYAGNKAVGTARIREINAATSKIERLAVLREYRQQGIGTKLMQSALAHIAQRNKSTVMVHAQVYIASMYQQLGFTIVGEQFVEAGIAHVKMIKHL
ncbi:MAG: GNAT family N-acetyltransferase [Cyanobacteria bacterium P01_C01_bin.72]